MLTRYWTWTSGPAADAVTSLPFGPLRFRAWTNGAASAVASGLPFGPLRFRAWTSAVAVVPVPVDQGGGYGRIRIPVDRLHALRLERDDELMAFIASASAALGLLD